MKKALVSILALALLLSMAACGAKPEGASSAPRLEENNGLLEYVDTETSPLEGCGIHTVVDAANGTVTFIKTDDKGQDSVEYLKFTPAENEVEKYYYVSMMGTGFYYYYDLNEGAMVRMENAQHEDTTESAKSNGRFDGPAATMQSEVTALQSYFEASFGKTIADAAAGK